MSRYIDEYMGGTRQAFVGTYLDTIVTPCISMHEQCATERSVTEFAVLSKYFSNNNFDCICERNCRACVRRSLEAQRRAQGRAQGASRGELPYIKHMSRFSK